MSTEKHALLRPRDTPGHLGLTLQYEPGPKRLGPRVRDGSLFLNTRRQAGVRLIVSEPDSSDESLLIPTRVVTFPIQRIGDGVAR